MAFRQEDFKKTSRKSAGDAPAAIYPHQMKDKKTLARLEIAIRTFDAAAGKRRKDMDAQAMTDFFGDPRLARGIVACLGQFYKYETPDFAQMVGRDAASRLRAAGLSRPVDVRAETYAYVNERYNGFLTEAGRAHCYAELGERFCLTAHQWDTLLHLDAEDNQILTRLGAVPTPAEIVALYNFHSLDTVLRRATHITLSGLTLSSGKAMDVRALAKALSTRAVVTGDGTTVRMEEAPPAPNTEGAPWGPLFSRRAGRLSRCLLFLAQAYGSRTTTGYADAKIGARTFRLMLGTDALRVLGTPRAAVSSTLTFRRRFETGLALHKDLLKRRTRGEANGWRIRRLPDPLVTTAGVLLPDFTLTREGRTVHVIIGPETPSAEGVITLSPGRKPLDGRDLLARVEAETNSLFALPPAAPPAVPQDIRALCDRAASEGLVRAADARRTLHLLDESPLIEWVRQAADPRVRYVPGIGLCSQNLVAAIQGEPNPGASTELGS